MQLYDPVVETKEEQFTCPNCEVVYTVVHSNENSPEGCPFCLEPVEK